MLNDVITKEIEAAAAAHGLPARLVRAVVLVESSGRPLVKRYESAFRWTDLSLMRPIGFTDAQEREFQKTSWGLMQIMGATARSLGFVGRPNDLMQIRTNLEYGCRLLAKNLRRYNGDERKAAAAYNAGCAKVEPDGRFKNQAYVDRIAEANGFNGVEWIDDRPC